MTARNKTQGSQPAITCTEWVRKPYDALRDYVKCSGPEREPVHTRISNTTAHDTTDQGRTGRKNMSLDSTRLPCAEAVRALSTRENGGAERNPVCPLPRAARSDSARAGGRPRPGDRYGEARAYDRRGRSRERILSTALCKLEGTAPLDPYPKPTNLKPTPSARSNQPQPTRDEATKL